jgi:pimeloyl-ACP methyl ester carboxylesterase
MPKATIAGVRIHYEITGNGPALVLTTGQGTGPGSRAELIAGLAERHAVLSYDQRGTGRSERAPQGQSIGELAEDIVALMDAAGFEKADVVGLSTGTGKATALAARHPERVTRLVLAAPWTHGDDYLNVIQNMRKAAARTMPSDHYTQFNALLIYPPEFRREHAARFATMAENALGSAVDADGLAARLDAILAFDARPLYPRITCRTLVVGARDDQVMPIWFAEQAAQAIGDSRLTILDGGGHLFPETRTAEFLQIVLSFLD